MEAAANALTQSVTSRLNFERVQKLYLREALKKCNKCYIIGGGLTWLISGGPTETFDYRPPCPVPPYQDP